MRKGLDDSSEDVAASNLEAIMMLLVFTRVGRLTTLFRQMRQCLAETQIDFDKTHE